MKKLIFILAGLLTVSVINAQSLEEIVKKFTAANKLDKISGYKTLKLTAKTSAMGMEMPVEIWIKNPNKIKTVTSMGGQEIISVFDGQKGYMVNPMAGSNAPIEMTESQVKDLQRSNVLQNYMDNYLKNGQLTLLGEDNVNGKPAIKIKAALEGGTNAIMFIDKGSYLLLKTTAEVNQGGMAMTMESYPSEYTETNGILLPMKTTISMSGMEMVTTFTKIEVDIPMDDSVFKIK
jgi:outer membrane lipoprotein-sorting protein